MHIDIELPALEHAPSKISIHYPSLLRFCNCPISLCIIWHRISEYHLEKCPIFSCWKHQQKQQQKKLRLFDSQANFCSRSTKMVNQRIVDKSTNPANKTKRIAKFCWRGLGGVLRWASIVTAATYFHRSPISLWSYIRNGWQISKIELCHPQFSHCRAIFPFLNQVKIVLNSCHQTSISKG